MHSKIDYDLEAQWLSSSQKKKQSVRAPSPVGLRMLLSGALCGTTEQDHDSRKVVLYSYNTSSRLSPKTQSNSLNANPSSKTRLRFTMHDGCPQTRCRLPRSNLHHHFSHCPKSRVPRKSPHVDADCQCAHRQPGTSLGQTTM